MDGLLVSWENIAYDELLELILIISRIQEPDIATITVLQISYILHIVHFVRLRPFLDVGLQRRYFCDLDEVTIIAQ